MALAAPFIIALAASIMIALLPQITLFIVITAVL
jgi:hypothetical protein